MSALTLPLHVGAIGGKPVRFFKGPSGAPEMPWHAVDDLYQALGLPRDLRRQLLRMTKAAWQRDLRTVATPDGIVTIAPHYVAQGLIGAAVEAMGAASRIEIEYALAGGAALKVLTGDLPPMASVAYALDAFHNTSDAIGGEP